jgi:polyisoprenyl-teichoic acid--peptidoglycan teichoic acid transferase
MSSRSSPATAASLSFVLPGLGQVAIGAVRRGRVIAFPAIVVLLAVIGLMTSDPMSVADFLLRPDVLLGLLIVNVALTAYHLGAIVDAYRIAGRSGRRTVGHAAPIVLATLLALTLTIHGAVEAIGYQTYATLGSVFVAEEPGTGWSIPDPSVEPEPSAGAVVSPSPAPAGSPSASASASPSRTPTPSASPVWARDGRLDVLLIGSDAGPDRWSLRTDTMVVLSIDIASGRAVLFGIPRNMVGVPLPPESADAVRNGRFPGLLNALYVYAMGHPADFPGGAARGFRAVTGAIQELVGVRLDGVVVVNLSGFVRLVDALGGLWIDVPERLLDRNYPLEDGSGHIRLDIRPGCQLLDGRHALAYARSRHQDSDYGRMRRQQQVLVALARQVDPLALVPKVPELLATARDNLWTTIKRSAIADLARLAAGVDVASVRTVLFVPSRYPSHLTSSEITQIRKVVRSAFDGPVKPRATPRPGSTTSCP